MKDSLKLTFRKQNIWIRRYFTSNGEKNRCAKELCGTNITNINFKRHLKEKHPDCKISTEYDELSEK